MTQDDERGTEDEADNDAAHHDHNGAPNEGHLPEDSRATGDCPAG
jgi:hypothetical protein